MACYVLTRVVTCFVLTQSCHLADVRAQTWFPDMLLQGSSGLLCIDSSCHMFCVDSELSHVLC